MKIDVIDSALLYVKDFFSNEYSGHDYWHTFRVYKMASNLANQEKAELVVVQLAALLHDVDDIKLSPRTYENKDNAVIFMRNHQVEEETICRVCTIIDEVSYRGTDSVQPSSIEGKCVQDADRLDAIGAIGIARAFSYGGNHNRMIYDPQIKPNLNMNEQEYRSTNSTTVNHFYEKLFNLKALMNTDSARFIADKREEVMRSYLEEFLLEWDGEK